MERELTPYPPAVVVVVVVSTIGAFYVFSVETSHTVAFSYGSIGSAPHCSVTAPKAPGVADALLDEVYDCGSCKPGIF